ncbi:Pathogenesis-related protein PR-1 [Linum grandiflorum]
MSSTAQITKISPIILLLLIFFLVALPTYSTAQSLAVERRGESLSSQFLSAHNKVRAGYYLPALKWNRTLARFARHYAYTRRNDCQLRHSDNRMYGENMFWSKYGHWSPANVVRKWAEENQFYDFGSNRCLNQQPCGHFTQLIWKSTTQLGCSRVRCYGGKGFLYICAYSPPGNYYFEGPLGGIFKNSII